MAVKYNRTSQTNPNRQRRTTASNRSIVSKRSTNSAIAKKYNKVKKAYRPMTTVNKSAIMTLSKQVKKLQLQRYGFKQYQHQFIKEIPGDNPSNYVSPTQTQPIAFMVNDFYLDGKIWQGGILNGAPQLTQVRRFDKVDNNLPINTEYMFNHKQQLDTVNFTHYLPISTTLRFRVEYLSNVDFQTPVRVRFQIFKFKNAVINGKFQLALPYNLGAYWHMCDKNPETRNHLNTSEYHDLVMDKSVYVTPRFDHNSTLVLDKYLNMKIQFPAKEVKLDPSNSPSGQETYNIIPTKDQYWCLISTDTNEIDRVKVHLERWNVWRDTVGVGN